MITKQKSSVLFVIIRGFDSFLFVDKASYQSSIHPPMPVPLANTIRIIPDRHRDRDSDGRPPARFGVEPASSSQYPYAFNDTVQAQATRGGPPRSGEFESLTIVAAGLLDL